MVEQSSVNAMCKELEVRFELGSEFKIFPPSVCTALTLEQGEDDLGGEMTIFRDEVAKAKHVFFVVWAEPPRHYTYLYSRRPEDHGCRRVASCRHVQYRTAFPYVSGRAVPHFPTCRHSFVLYVPSLPQSLNVVCFKHGPGAPQGGSPLRD